MFFKKISIAEKVIRIAALGLLSGILLSWPLWDESVREFFPTLPVWGEAVEPPSDWPKAIDPPIIWGSLVRVMGLVTLLVFTFAFPGKKLFPALLSAWLLALCALDLNRLQPWVWFYLLVFGAIIFGKKENQVSTTNVLRWLLAGFYFWSGFNKLTPYFAEDNFAWFCGAFDFTKSFGHYPALGYAVAMLEMSFAAGLLWEKTQPYFQWMVVGFHGVIVIFLIKLDWNWVVIPWNLAMAGMVWVLYCSYFPVSTPAPKGRQATTSSRSTLSLPSLSGPGLTRGEAVVIGLIWLAPILYFFNLWPYTLSWQLYSNTQPEATFYREKGPGFATIPEEWIWEEYGFDDRSKLLLDDWAMDELKAPVFASERTFRQMGKYLIKNCNDSKGLYILTVNRWDKSAEKMEKIPCRELTTPMKK